MKSNLLSQLKENLIKILKKNKIDSFIPLLAMRLLDCFEPGEFLHAKIPNSKLEIFEGYGHGSLLVDDFQRASNTIWKFIEQHIG